MTIHYAALERSIEKTAHRHDPASLARLRSAPWVGNIPTLVLRYEIEDTARFARVQEFALPGSEGPTRGTVSPDGIYNESSRSAGGPFQV